MLEEIAAGDGSVSTLVSVHNAPTCEILERFGTDAQRERWLRPMATGAAVSSFALTEPGAGSDASGLRTRAERHDGGYVINGAKQFISNARVGQTTILFAVTDPVAGKKGISAFIVDNATPGFSVARVENKLGQKASDSCALSFDDMQVPDDQRIGEEGEGLKIALSTLESGRIGIAAQAVGIAQGALDYALGYAQERKQFGKPISDFQGLQFLLADMGMKVEAARQMTYAAAGKSERGDRDLTFFGASAKCFASDVAMQVTTDAVQVLGGYGFTRDYPVERMMRDAKITQIYEGTNQVQRMVMARSLLKG